MNFLRLTYLHVAALILFSGGLFLTSCQEDDPEIGVSTETVEIHIRNMWDYGDFQLHVAHTYPAYNGSTATNFDTLKYYVSNIKLQNADGSWWSHPDSYFLVDAGNPNSCILKLNEVPYGVYTSVSYMLGVDSTKQQAGGPYTGALAASNKMYITADSGFVMLKAFGATSTPGVFARYLHGYEAPHPIQVERTHWFGTVPMTITREGNYRVYVHNYVHDIFKTLSVTAKPTIYFSGNDAVQSASDFFTSFAFDSIKE